jgi:hypothetical protein
MARAKKDLSQDREAPIPHARLQNGDLNWLANFIWGIADDVLRDLYVRGKYRDVILPMTVLRRLDAVLEPTKQVVLDMKATLDKAGITNQDSALRQAAGQDFYNTSKFTLRDLRSRASQQQLTVKRTSKRTLMPSRRMYRTSSTISNSAIRFLGFRKRTRSAR